MCRSMVRVRSLSLSPGSRYLWIEIGRKQGSVATLRKLANALGVVIDI